MPKNTSLSIEKLWICPPLAFARFGKSKTPMENFHWEQNDYSARGTAETVIKPSQTFVVSDCGVINAHLPEKIVFRDNHKWRPVCPFFELHCLLSDGYKGVLDIELLKACELELKDIVWTVETANRKAFHYTLKEGDKVEAKLQLVGNNHERHVLKGKSVSAVKPLVSEGKFVDFGSLQIIKPSSDFPEIRIRVTPPKGLIYAPTNTNKRNLQSLLKPNQSVEDFLQELRCILNPESPWPSWAPVDKDSRTNPGGLYAQEPDETSLGFLDDSSDGLITATIAGINVSDKKQTAFARFTCCPQDFQPDRRPFVSVADGLSDLTKREEVLDPKFVEGSGWAETEMEIADLMQRVRETMEASNLDHQNLRSKLGNEGITHINPDFPFKPEPPRPGHPLPLTQKGRDMHKRFLAYDVFKQRFAKNPELFKDIIRNPVAERGLYDKKMPALMRGSDSYPMTLRQRQYDLMQVWLKKLQADAETFSKVQG